MKLSATARNVRRFFRINMPLRYHITPSTPIKDREIYASGANYFPPSVRSQLTEEKKAALHSLTRIQEFKDALTEIFGEMINHAEFFGQCCETMSRGLNPKLNPAMWQTLSAHQHGFPKLSLLEAASPKTHKHLKSIEEKYIFFVKNMIESLSKSSAGQFYAPDYLPYAFRIDELRQIFSEEKYDNVPLAQSILHTAKYVNTYTEIFRQIHDDHTLRQNPQDWPLENVNVSASGLAVSARKTFRLHERMDVLIYFAHANKVLKFDGVVVNIQTDPAEQIERVALNFEFPDGKDQDFLQTEIQKYEIDECFDICV